MFLEGVRVLDLSRVLAGPLAAQILGDLGAEVLKIEAPSGDDTRTWGPPFQGDMAAYFQSCNRNKVSLVLDLKQETDRARLYALAEQAHVVIDNFTPRVRRKLGLEPERLHEIHSGLVTLGISGYRGARADEPGYDIMIQAESGLMGITGPANGQPYKVGVAMVDVLTGMMAANGVLAALFRQQRTGTGAALSISLYQTALWSLINVGTNHLVSGEPSRRWGNQHANIVPYQDFDLADRTLIIGVGNDRQYRRLCDLLNIADARLWGMNNADRLQNRDEIIGLLAEKLAFWQSDDLLPLLKEAGIPAAPILRPDEALTQVQAWDPTAILALSHENLGTIRLPDTPLSGSGIRTRHTPPPQKNEGGEALAARWLTER